ncbi:GerAB/ArcD/ProY family transporter [Paenibacillus alkalitolerans]|uniref:GerAB/ArcD/ProY family transporter n=1 Tax=Paenibacillus alkalitolerans TaxID=2799335 RepID=UPI0018F6EDAE|nr:GerAB/ArcD/ProY family transporter [Paenibacillus alkalitolerans]
MEKAKISAGQLFALIFLFEMGTALVVSLGLKAEKDAWLAILLGLAGGLLLFLVYTSLYKLYPALPLTGYLRAILGKWIGWPACLLYIIFFLYGAARDLRDGGELLTASFLDQTPVFVNLAIMILSVGYVLNKGIEVFSRTAQICMVVMFAAGFISNFLMYASGIADYHQLLPVLAKGWEPVVNTAATQTFEFPFSELICFTMLFPYLNDPKNGVRAGFAAVLFSGLTLSFSIAMYIAVLGVDIAGRATFPLLSAISMINIGEFIQRLDVFAVLTLIIGDFFKVGIFFYAAVIGGADLFRIQDYRKLVYPFALLILIISMIIASNFAEHIEEGNFALRTVFLLFGVAIPLLLWAAARFRRLVEKKNPPPFE